MQRRTLLNLVGGLGLSLATAPLAMAADDQIVLSVTNTVTGETKNYTDADLLALPQTSFRTSTIWTEGVKTFSGPTLKAVLKDADMPAKGLKLYAVNDYNVPFPVENLHDTAPIIANRIDGEPFPLRRKGPLWVIFPFDQAPNFNSEEIFALCVWQLNKISVGGM